MTHTSVMTCLRVIALVMALRGAASAQAGQETVDWPLHNLDLAGSRFSTLDQVNTSNVETLTPGWLFSCALGFSWTLDCERVLAGGVSRWGNQIRDRRRRREPGGRPETPPIPAVAADCQWGGSARWCCVCCAGRISSRCLSRAVGITAARASQGRDRCLAAGQASLKSRPPDARNEDDRRLQAKIGELLMENE